MNIRRPPVGLRPVGWYCQTPHAVGGPAKKLARQSGDRRPCPHAVPVYALETDLWPPA